MPPPWPLSRASHFPVLIIIALTAGGGMVAISSASPPRLVTPSLLARGTFEENFDGR
jgi:hypothetical protein